MSETTPPGADLLVEQRGPVAVADHQPRSAPQRHEP